MAALSGTKAKVGSTQKKQNFLKVENHLVSLPQGCETTCNQAPDTPSNHQLCTRLEFAGLNISPKVLDIHGISLAVGAIMFAFFGFIIIFTVSHHKYQRFFSGQSSIRQCMMADTKFHLSGLKLKSTRMKTKRLRFKTEACED